MMYALMWDGVANTLLAQPLEDVLSANRISYGDDRAVFSVPIAVGTRAEMDACRTSCAATILKRAQARATYEARPHVIRACEQSAPHQTPPRPQRVSAAATHSSNPRGSCGKTAAVCEGREGVSTLVGEAAGGAL